MLFSYFSISISYLRYAIISKVPSNLFLLLPTIDITESHEKKLCVKGYLTTGVYGSRNPSSSFPNPLPYKKSIRLQF